MKYRREKDGRIVLSLFKGDRLRACVENLAQQEGIVGARVHAIGVLKDPEIGWYELETRGYHKQVFAGLWEVISLTGNLTLLDDKPLLHAHVAMSGHDYKVVGGHLFDGTVGIVLEMFIEPLTEPLYRRTCEDIGLARWEP